MRDFDLSSNPEIPKARIWELASGQFIEERASVLLCGPTGVGKTFIAQPLGVQICGQTSRGVFTKTHLLVLPVADSRRLAICLLLSTTRLGIFAAVPALAYDCVRR